MYKIDLKFVYTDLKGNPIPLTKESDEPSTLGDLLPDIVLAYKLEGASRKLSLAQSMIDKDSIQLNNADLKIVKDAVKAGTFSNNPAFDTILKGRTEDYLETLVEEKKVPNKEDQPKE